jgi:hypothetical protein
MGGSGGDKFLTNSGINVSGGNVTPYSMVYTSGVNPSWGFGGRDPYWTRTGGDVNTALTSFFYGPNGVSETMAKMFSDVASAFGQSSGIAKNVINEAFLNLGDIDLIGAKSSADVEKIITEKISTIEDIAARSIFGDAFINQYIKTNEGAAETITRLYIDLLSISSMFDKIGIPMAKTGNAAVSLSESLITLAGGLDSLTEASNAYYDKFFSDEEKQAQRQKELTTVLGGYGLALPGGRAEYRALVDSRDLKTSTGQEAFVALLQMAKSADQYYTEVEKANEAAASLIKPENYSSYVAYQQALAAIPKYADGGYFGGGYRIVGESGPELEYTAPSHIYNNKDTKDLLNNGELIEEIRELRKEIGAGNYQIASNTQRSAKYLQYLEQWDGDGIPAARN